MGREAQIAVHLTKALDCKEIQPVHSKGDQPWDFFGRNDAKAETPVLWPPHAKSWLIGKDCDAGRDWGQEKKGTTEDEMAGWHHWLDGCESQWTPGVGDGQGGLTCCDSWGHKESDMTERRIWSDANEGDIAQYCLSSPKTPWGSGHSVTGTMGGRKWAEEVDQVWVMLLSLTSPCSSRLITQLSYFLVTSPNLVSCKTKITKPWVNGGDCED